MEDFVRKTHEEAKLPQNNYIRKRDETHQVVANVEFRSVSDLPLKETGDFDDSDFFGFAAISNKIRAGWNLNSWGN